MMTAPAVTSAAPVASAGLVTAAGRSRAGRRTLALLLPALAAAGLLLVAARAWPGAGPALAGVALAGLLLLGARLWHIWHETPAAVAARLNRHHPALEDSAALLLRPASDLNLLEGLQQQRLLNRLPELAATGPLLPVSFRPALSATALLLALAALVWWQRPGAARHCHRCGDGNARPDALYGPARHARCGSAHGSHPVAGAAARLH